MNKDLWGCFDEMILFEFEFIMEESVKSRDNDWKDDSRLDLMMEG